MKVSHHDNPWNLFYIYKQIFTCLASTAFVLYIRSNTARSLPTSPYLNLKTDRVKLFN